MPSKLSKFAVDASCKDFVHPWTTSCIGSTAGLGLHSIQESAKIYTTIYLLALLMKRKVPSKEDLQKTILGILQSTAFLSWSSFTYGAFLCLLRRFFGNFNIITVSFLPSFISSFLSILIERPSRRTLLSLYVSNIATETLFRMAIWRGYVSPIPHLEVYIFAIGMATLTYFYRAKSDHKDTIFSIIRFVLGQHEEARHLKRRGASPSTSSKKVSEESCDRGLLQRSLNTYGRILDTIKARARTQKHPTCAHPQSCLRYVATSSAKMFALGAASQLAVKMVFQFNKIIREPSWFLRVISRRNTYDLAVFIGGFAGLYKLLSCGLRRAFDNDSPYYAVPAGLIASVAFMRYPSRNIALSVMWKALHILWNNGVENKKVPEVKWFVIFLYCFSTAVLFHAAIIEPQNLRASYWKFLWNLSGGRVAVMGRIPLENFGYNSHESLQEVLRRTNTTDKLTYSF